MGSGNVVGRGRGGARKYGAMLAAPIFISVFSAARLWKRPWAPSGDWAALWIRADDVFTRHTPLAGAYSTHNFSHPGPSIFWLVWILKRASFDSVPRAFALLAIIAGATMCTAIVMAYRWFDRRVAWVTAVLGTALLHELAGRRLGDYWNPLPPVIWLFVYAIALFAALDTRRRSAVYVAVVFGSLAAQAHVSFLFIVGITTTAALVRESISTFRRRGIGQPHVTRATRTWVGPTVLCATLWSPALLDGINGGNPQQLLHYFRIGHGTRLGIPGGFRLAATELIPWGPLLRVGQPADLVGGIELAPWLWVFLVPLPLLTLTLIAIRFHTHRSTRASTALAGAWIIAAITPALASGLEGFLFEYLVTFAISLAAIYWWLIATAAITMLPSPSAVSLAVPTPGFRQHVFGFTAAVATGALAIQTLTLPPRRFELPGREVATVVARASSRLAAKLGPRRAPIVLDYLDDQIGLGAPGVMATLAKQYDIRTHDGAAQRKWGYAINTDPVAPADKFTIVVNYESSVLTPRDACVLRHTENYVVDVSGLSTQESLRFKQLRIANFVARSKIPAHDAAELSALQQRSTRIVILRGDYSKECMRFRGSTG